MAFGDKQAAKNLFAILCSAGVDPPLATGLLYIAFDKQRGGSKKMVGGISGFLYDYRKGQRMSLTGAKLLFREALGEQGMRSLIESIYGTGAPDDVLLLGPEGLDTWESIERL